MLYHYDLFNHLPIEWQFDCLQFLTIINKAGMSITV